MITETVIRTRPWGWRRKADVRDSTLGGNKGMVLGTNQMEKMVTGKEE